MRHPLDSAAHLHHRLSICFAWEMFYRVSVIVICVLSISLRRFRHIFMPAAESEHILETVDTSLDVHV